MDLENNKTSSTPNNNKKLPKKSTAINKNLLALKISQSLYYGAMFAILPYLTIHIKDIGISVQEMAVIYAILPFTSFVGPPLAGMAADKFGQYKLVLQICLFFNGFFHTCLYFVPTYALVEVRREASAVLMPSGRDVQIRWPRCPGLPADDTCTMPSFNVDNLVLSKCKFVPELKTSGSAQNDSLPSWQFCREDESALCQTVQHKSNWTTSLKLSQQTTTIRTGMILPNLQSIGSTRGKMTINKTLWLSDSACSVNHRSQQPFEFRVGDTKLADTEVTCKVLNLPMEPCIHVSGNIYITFYVYLMLRILALAFAASCFTVFDATTLHMVKHYDSDYGKQRLWPILSQAVVSPITGLMIDTLSKGKDYTEYSAAFYFSDSLLLLTMLTVVMVPLHVEVPEESILKNLRRIITYPTVNAFIIMMFILGNMFGFVESYLFIYLKDELGAPNYLLGLTLTTGSLISLPFLWGGVTIVEKCGRFNTIILAFFVYCIRYVGYSFINNPWLCFPFEALEVFTYHLMWVAAATYCAMLAPKGLLATLNGVVGGSHYSLGKGSGSFIGGYLMGASSTRMAFRYFGIAAAVCGIAYLFTYIIWLKGAERKHFLMTGADVKSTQNGSVNNVDSKSKRVKNGTAEPEEVPLKILGKTDEISTGEQPDPDEGDAFIGPTLLPVEGTRSRSLSLVKH